MLPGPDGPEAAADARGRLVDVFEVSDFLSERYRRLFIVDLDGIEHGNPQLDWLQELSRDTDTWVDAGVPTGEQAIDVLVTGCRRAVLSTTHLASERELLKAWSLSTSLGFEIEVRDGRVVARAKEWNGQNPADLARHIHEIGLAQVVLSPRPDDVDWPTVRSVAATGPLWVDGSFAVADAPRLSEAGASGGIFHIGGLLEERAREEAR